MKRGSLRRPVSGVAFLVICAVVALGEAVAAQEASPDGVSIPPATSASQPEASRQTAGPVLHSLPLLAEGSNSCEIVSCGMGIKQTCQVTCPADKTPKCSCDCERSFGPMCMDYKANCRCE